jgi:lipopolysaccharide transport system permease protein
MYVGAAAQSARHYRVLLRNHVDTAHVLTRSEVLDELNDRVRRTAEARRKGVDYQYGAVHEDRSVPTGWVPAAHAPDYIPVRGFRGMPTEWIESGPARGLAPGFSLREAWSHRELAWLLALRQLKLRYKQTAFGVAWAVLQPLAGMALLTLVFSRAGVAPSGDVPYAVFVLVGFVAWTYVASAVTTGAESLIEDPTLVTKVYFPRILAPLSALLPFLVDLGVSLVIVAVAMAVAGIAPGAQLALLPAAVGMLVLVAGGAAAWLSALNVAYRDVRYALPFVLQAWFLVSPVFYATSVIPAGAARTVVQLNPLVGAIDLFRWTLGVGPSPGSGLAISAGAMIALVASGTLYFARRQARVADIA